MGDDGFGPLAVELFRCRYECGQEVEIVDLGTPGLDFALYLYGGDLVVIVDAVHADEKPGTLRIYSEIDFLAGRSQLRLTAHDSGLQESLAQLKLLGQAPSELIVIGVIPKSCSFGKGVSPAVLRTASVAVDTIARLLTEHDVRCCRRHARVRANAWWLSGGRLNSTRRVPIGRKCRPLQKHFDRSGSAGLADVLQWLRS
jgi:hydrogenase maturation protease